MQRQRAYVGGGSQTTNLTGSWFCSAWGCGGGFLTTDHGVEKPVENEFSFIEGVGPPHVRVFEIIFQQDSSLGIVFRKIEMVQKFVTGAEGSDTPVSTCTGPLLRTLDAELTKSQRNLTPRACRPLPGNAIFVRTWRFRPKPNCDSCCNRLTNIICESVCL